MKDPSMNQDSLWNVFVPYQLLREPPGNLIGHVDHHNHLIYVSGISHSETHLSKVNLLGYWHSTEASVLKDTKPKRCSPWISLVEDNKTVNCSLLLLAGGHTNCLDNKPVVCVLFNPVQVLKSYTLIQPSSGDIIGTDASKIVNKTTEKDMQDTVTHRLRSRNVYSSDKKQTLAKESPVDSQSQHFLPILKQMMFDSPTYKTLFSSDIKLFYAKRKESRSSWRLPWFIIWIFCCLERVFLYMVNTCRLCCLPFPRIIHTPTIFQYLQDKYWRWKTCFSLTTEEKFNAFLSYNCYGQQLLDTALGLTVVVMVTQHNIHHLASTAVLDWADSVASQLTELVQWLMGAPAGLKLNAQLTKFFGHFFIYHIYLWTGYVSLLRSVMPSLLWYCNLMGVLGVSAQICLLSDLISMLTLHIYCFYVYAAKIFSLQMYMLGSLWRLFRGKKWNVLRSRVDSATYTTDQLFVGTLFFTVLLFLLPTTALYYAVFTLLRLSTLTVQGCLAYLLELVVSTPVFTLVVRLLFPSLVAGNVKFSISNAAQNDDTCLVLTMQTCHIPFEDLLNLTKPLLTSNSKESHSWGEFLSHLATGKLVYPWVEPFRATVVKDVEKDD